MDDFIIFTGSSNPDLANKICNYLNVPLGGAVVKTFSDGEVMPPETISGEVRDAVSESVADLPFEVKWVDSESDAPPVLVEPGAYAGGEAALVTLGSIHENEDGTVHVAFWLHCGSLCGIGMTYVLEFVDGAWVVTGTTGPIMMS